PTRVGVTNPLEDAEEPSTGGVELGEETTDDSDHGAESEPAAIGAHEETVDGEEDVLEPLVDVERTRQGRLDPEAGPEGFEIDFSERLAAKTSKDKAPVTVPRKSGVDSEHDT